MMVKTSRGTRTSERGCPEISSVEGTGTVTGHPLHVQGRASRLSVGHSSPPTVSIHYQKFSQRKPLHRKIGDT